MRVSVSLPDDLYEEIERQVSALGISRSRLFADAVREYLARHDPDQITDALNRVYELDTDPDAAVAAAALHAFARTEWQ